MPLALALRPKIVLHALPRSLSSINRTSKRSAKKVKLRFANDSPVSMDTEDTTDPSLISQIPDTPTSTAPPHPDPPPPPPKQPFFKDKLLDGSFACEEEDEDIILVEEDMVSLPLEYEHSTDPRAGRLGRGIPLA